jgi:regulator of cell morphogenesis and NO signaling
MKVDPHITAANLAILNPAAVPLLEASGIDFYCRGNQTLEALCAEAGIDVVRMIGKLRDVPDAANPSPWAVRPLADLTHHLRATAHARLREKLENTALAVDAVSQSRQDEEDEIRRIFETFSDALLLHLRQDEDILFPYMSALERASHEGTKFPTLLGGTLYGAIPRLLQEHETLSRSLATFRALLDTLPDESPALALRDAVAELTSELHDVIHLEDNLLLPKSLKIEDERRSSCSFEESFRARHHRC